MADAKKKKNQKNSGAKTRAKKKPASATATEIEQMKQQESAGSAKKQIRAICVFALAVILFAIAVIKTDAVIPKFLHNLMFGLFGICAYIMPVLLGASAIFSAMDKKTDKLAGRIAQSGFLIWFISAAVDIFSAFRAEDFIAHISECYKYEKIFGGIIGGILGYPLEVLCGETISKIIIVILIIVTLMLVTGTTLVSAYRMLSKPIKTAGKAIETKMEEIEKRKQQGAQPQIDFPLSGDEENVPSVEEVTERPLNVAEKRKKVIATYRGEDYVPEEPAEEIIEEKPNEELEPIEPITFGAIRKETVEVPKEEAPKTPETEEKAEEKAPVIPEGLSLEDIPEDEEAYRFPPITLLKEPKVGVAAVGDHEATGEQLVNILRSFGVETKIINISVGPSITRYELQPAAGVKISKITGLSDDIAMNLATAGVRIEAPIPNKPAVGIEVPNRNTSIVTIREIIDSKPFMTSKSKLTVAMGRDIAGTPIVTDIAKMPHGLIAGATGSGKSVCINSIIMSLLFNATPDEVKLLMIDPKVVELGVYNGIPHLLVPVVTDPRKASGALGWAVTEMEKRYKMFAENDVRNLEGYNRLAEKRDDLIKMPQIVIVIDELADLMMTAPHEVEDSICRIAQKARAAGMHLLIATQRPSVDVITGIIKANIPSRIAFAVSSAVDSRTILDMGGAERLLGKGDMLFNPVGAIKPKRIQGCFVSDEEVEAVVEFIKGIRTNEYDSDIMEEIERQAAAKDSKGSKDSGSSDGDDADPMLSAAIECVVEMGQASTSLLQRRLKLGYARAARIMDEMAERGIVGPYEGAKPRAVLISKAQLLEMQARGENTEE